MQILAHNLGMEPIPVPADQWIHLIFTWDGNKLFLLRNNEEVVIPVNASGNLTGDATSNFRWKKTFSRWTIRGTD